MFDKKDLIYVDYKWTAVADLDNPKIINNSDSSLLNRTEGYEMIYYIRSLAKTWDWPDDAIRACQKLEKTIKTKVPETIRTHGEIKSWIQSHFKEFWDTL